MPLTYDNDPGSWGVYSRDWPSRTFNNEQDADRAFVACSRECVVPYGSYVKDRTTLRIETFELLAKLNNHLALSPYSTAEQVLAAEKNGQL